MSECVPDRSRVLNYDQYISLSSYQGSHDLSCRDFNTVEILVVENVIKSMKKSRILSVNV